jgi:hypothetical protein
MAAEIRFNRIIRTSAAAQPMFPPFIESVEQAIDHVQELPRDTLRLERWHAATLALWAAVDFPADTARLATADPMFCRALLAEGWLNEIPPM